MLAPRLQSVPVPHRDDPILHWRRWAHAVSADDNGFELCLRTAWEISFEHADHVMPVLLRRSRTRARTQLLQDIALLSSRYGLGEGAVHVLFGELLADTGVSRTACMQALSHAREGSLRAVSLALGLVQQGSIRACGERERVVALQWSSRFGVDGSAQCLSDAGVLRRWVQGDGAPNEFDHALVLCASGALSSTVEQVRVMLRRLVESTGRASQGVLDLLKYLSTVSGSSEGLSSSMVSPVWPDLRAHVEVQCAVHDVGALRMLEGVATRLASTEESIRMLRAGLEVCVSRAWFGPDRELSVRALSQGIPRVLDALVALVPTRADQTVSCAVPSCTELFGLLLGRMEREPGTHVNRPAWLAEDLRLLVLRVALRFPLLGGVEAALRDMELRGVPTSVHPLLRNVARQAESVLTRQHARQLARGERL